MNRHNGDGKQLQSSEVQELRLLIEEAEEIARGNARRLASRRRRLLRNVSKAATNGHTETSVRDREAGNSATSTEESLVSDEKAPPV